MSFASSSWRRPMSASSRTFVAKSEISSTLSRAKSIKNVRFQQKEEPEEEEKPYVDPSIPVVKGPGLGLPDFLKKRAALPKVVDPMADAFGMRQAAGSLKKANPKAPRPVEEFFKLKQTNKGPLDTESTASEAPKPQKPPKAVYVKKDRKELYDHKIELKPFNWFDQKKAQAQLNKHNEELKQKGEIVDIQGQIRVNLVQKRDIMKNFDKKNSLKQTAPKDDITNPTEKVDEENSKRIWDAFGAYIARNLKSGKGIHVPKFGQFTFTFPNHLQMGGLTNPDYRDPQIRTPVFIVGKDFVYGVKMRSAIAGSWAHDIHMRETRSQCSEANSDLLSKFSDRTGGGTRNTVIPFELRDNNGIVPKHQINYTEISVHSGVSKQTAKDHCELIYKKYSSRAAAGKRVEADIPHVGKLSISIGLAAVIFNNDIINNSRGKTAIIHRDRYHSANIKNNMTNTKMLDYGASKSFANLKSKLDSQFEITNMMQEIDQKLQVDNRNKRLERAVKVEVMDRMLRPASANGARSLKSFKSRVSSARGAFSVAGSAISVVPELDPVVVMNMAWEIYGLRIKIVGYAKQNHVGLREILNSTKIMKILHELGYRIKIENLKALLKELSFNWNGASCSITQLIDKLKIYTKEPHIDPINALINAELQEAKPKTKGVKELPEDQDTLHKIMDKQNNPLEVLKELFYNSEKTLYQIFEEFKIMNNINKAILTQHKFECLIKKYSKLTSAEILQIWNMFRPEFPESVSFQEFKNMFEITVPADKVRFSVFPDQEYFAQESRIMSRVLEWMLARSYTSEEAFERLLGSVQRAKQKTLGQYEFQKAVMQEIGLKTPEIDFLFELLAQKEKHIDLDKWTSKIKTQVPNPLNHIRSIVKGLSADHLMTKLGLKPLDLPLDYPQFCSAIKYFDPKISEVQLHKLFNKLSENGKIPVQKFIKNLSGSDYDTVDNFKHMLKQLYNEIYRKNKSVEFTKILEKADNNNDGELDPVQVGFFLKYITGGQNSIFSDTQIEKFVFQLPKIKGKKIVYVDMLELITNGGNRNHNPFKSLVKKIDFFLEANKVSISQLLQKLDPVRGKTDGVSLEIFAKFLKDKVEKNKEIENIKSYCNLIDIDKDARISAEDLQTCIVNINSDQFFKNGGQNLQHPQFNAENKFYVIKNLVADDSKITEICKQLSATLKSQGSSLSKIFKDFDSDGDGMLNFGEFSKGLRTIMSINQPTLEKMFNLMDLNKIGMVDFDKFHNYLKVKDPGFNIINNIQGQVIQSAKNDNFVEDTFEWQNDIIEKIKIWFKSEGIWQRDLELDYQDAFKSFDINFDGKVCKNDMKKALVSFVKIPQEEITDIRMDRLFKIMSFYKTETLQPSDFDRLFNGQNPLMNDLNVKDKFSKSLGGGFTQTSIHDWKMAALQQLGMIISKKYVSLEKSFEDASEGTNKVNFEKFNKFVEKHHGLKGFNLPLHLVQKLFGEIEPHKKTYMSFNDWKSAFGSFNFYDSIVVEYKEAVQCTFVDVPSAFAFYQNFGESILTQIDFDRFSVATQDLIPTRKFTKVQLKHLFDLILGDSFFQSFGLQPLRLFFGGAVFTGKQKLYKRADPILTSIGKKGESRKIHKAQLMNSFGENILSRLRILVQQSGKSLDDIFNQFDTDGSGALSRVEFRKALRAMNLGLSILEINEIITLVDQKDLTGHSRYDKVQGDGKIDYDEFADKLYYMPPNEQRMLQRANARLVLMKENIGLYMTSVADAFRMFSKHKKGFLTFKEFEKLVNQLCVYSEEKMPKPEFSVLKDMFDAIDIGKDGLIDYKEWTSTFQHMGVPDTQPATFGTKNAIKYTGISSWDNGDQHQRVGACIARNRNSLIKKFKENSTHTSYDGQPKFVTFQQAKQALDELLFQNFKNQINDEKLAAILAVGLVQHKLSSQKPKEVPSFGYGYYEEKAPKESPYQGLYDFMKILNVYKERYDLKVGVF